MHACKPTCKCKLLLKPVPEKTKSNESSEIVASEETEQRPEFDTSSSYDFTIKSRYSIKHEISTEGSISKGEHEQLPDLDVLLGDKLRMPSIVTKTEEYLRMHRINELVNYLMVKIIYNTPEKPITFLVQLLDDCMLFRAGHTSAPIIYEKRHLEAVVNSFDPGRRGWLTFCQVRRIYWTLNLNFYGYSEEKFSVNEVLSNIEKQQEKELLKLLWAGVETPELGTSNSSELTLISSSVSRQ